MAVPEMTTGVDGCSVISRPNTGCWCRLLHLVICFVTLPLLATAQTNHCPFPEGVANAEILTSPPYLHGDVVTYRCFSSFSMSGVPSQSCDNGTWAGLAPSCSVISRADVHEQEVQFRSEETDTLRYGMVAMISAVLLLLLVLMAVGFCLTCRRCRSGAPPVEQSQHDSTEGRTQRTTRSVDAVVDVMSEHSAASSKPAKVVKGWRPFRHPVRDINTSTQ